MVINQMQVMEIVPSIAQDVHFAQGVEQGQACFVSDYSEDVLTDADVMEVVTSNLSPKNHREENAFLQYMGWEPVPYSYRVGFVMGWLSAWLSA